MFQVSGFVFTVRVRGSIFRVPVRMSGNNELRPENVEPRTLNKNSEHEPGPPTREALGEVSPQPWRKRNLGAWNLELQ
jgi:hypothetical protein